jgi:hypothetical protein
MLSELAVMSLIASDVAGVSPELTRAAQIIEHHRHECEYMKAIDRSLRALDRDGSPAAAEAAYDAAKAVATPEYIDAELSALLGPAELGRMEGTGGKLVQVVAAASMMRLDAGKPRAAWRTGLRVSNSLVLCPNGHVLYVPSGLACGSVALSKTKALQKSKRPLWAELDGICAEFVALQRQEAAGERDRLRTREYVRRGGELRDRVNAALKALDGQDRR